MKKRELWLDYVKALGVFFIVSAHAGYNIHTSYYYYVPIFFIIAGYVFRDKKIFQFIGSKIKRLYIPFVISLIFCTLIHMLLFKIGVIGNTYSLSELGTNFIRILLFDIPEKLSSPSWFIFALFISNIEFIILYKFSRLFNKLSDYVLGIICVILFIVGYYNRGFLNQFIWSNCTIVTMLFINMIYIYIGYLLKKKDIMKYMDEHQNVELYSVIISVIILMASLYVFNYNTDYRAGVFTNLVLTMIIPICGFIFLSFIPKKIISSYDKVSKVFSYIGQNTIYILMYHVACFQIVSTLLLKLGYFASSDLMNTWNNYIVVGNWKFVSILLAMSIPVIFKLLYDKLVLKIKG